jgi:hypothetical protein
MLGGVHAVQGMHLASVVCYHQIHKPPIHLAGCRHLMKPIVVMMRDRLALRSRGRTRSSSDGSDMDAKMDLAETGCMSLMDGFKGQDGLTVRRSGRERGAAGWLRNWSGWMSGDGGLQ